MSLYSDKGVVLRTYKLGEADRIVVIMTQNHGKVRAVAKGIRKTKSKIGARLEVLSHVEVLLYKGKELDIVNQVELIESSAPLHADLDRLTQGLSMLEAVDMIADDRQPSPHLYRMLVGALNALAHQASPLVLAAFYWKLLAAEGVCPQMERCVSCNSTGPLVAFDMIQGGVQCKECRTGVSISARAIELLQQVLGGQLNFALAQDASPATAEITHLATHSMEHHIERRLRSVAMFERG
ncbi:MAG: DNA repair protein RecO [Actinobacteria bacterium]|nr:MAG: DNA repair protein RecO [Actinomycetota bacterium]